MHPIPCNKGKEPIILDEADAPTDDKLSSGSSPPLSLSPAKNTRLKHVRGPHIALPSAMSLMARPIGQGEKQVMGSTSQAEPLRCVNIACKCDAINIICTSRLLYKADILHAANSSISGTRRHPLFALRATHS